MSISKAWDWNKNSCPAWLKPCEESYYIANDWKEKGVVTVLDFGCGLGRHSIFFAKQGFKVSAFDLSSEATQHLSQWAKKESLAIDITNADMLALPYADNSFDGIFAFHVISHTDSAGIKKIIGEISRVLKVGGQLYLTLCSKETWSFKDAGYPKIDDNTVVKTEAGPENGIPHFYVNFEDIMQLLGNYDIEKIRHTDDCYYSGQKRNSKHYFVAANLKLK